MLENRSTRSRMTIAVVIILLCFLLYQDRSISLLFGNFGNPTASFLSQTLVKPLNDSTVNSTSGPSWVKPPFNALKPAMSHEASKSTIARDGINQSSTFFGDLHTANHSNWIREEPTTERTGAGASLLNRSISIVVQLSGEMGNHLQKIAFGRAIQNILQDRYGLDSHLVLQHQQRGGKWVSAMQDVTQCFPNLRDYDFELGNSVEFTKRLQQQQEWLGNDNASKLILPNLVSSASVDDGLAYLVSLQRKNITSSISNVGSNANISLPFVYAQSFVDFEYIERYNSDLRALFWFDEAACCQEVPHPDESVFHFRNYLAEMPRKGKQKGFEELNPNQTALELFGHLKRGDGVAMTSRVNNQAAQAYVQAFQARGLSVRMVTNQTGVQDFCFLAKAQKELAGMARSTFLVWAAILGNATTNWLYSIDSQNTRKALGEEALVGHDWRTKGGDLQRRIRFVHFTPRTGNENESNSSSQQVWQ
jgi:hypothetical protein